MCIYDGDGHEDAFYWPRIALRKTTPLRNQKGNPMYNPRHAPEYPRV